MAEKKETIFADGFWFEKPHAKAPDFVKGKISIKVAEFISFLEAHKNGGGYVNLDLKKSKSGKLYVSLNEYKKGILKDPTDADREFQEDVSKIAQANAALDEAAQDEITF